MKNPTLFLLFGLLSPVAFATPQQAKPAHVAAGPTRAEPAPAEKNETMTLRGKHITLKQMSNREALNLKGTESSDTVTLGGQSDELITRAVFHLRYTFSPALLPGESHLKLSVNDEVIRVLPVTKDNVGHLVTQDVEINPQLFTNLTNIKFQLIGHYTHDCEDQLHSSLWMEVSGTSQLELTVRPLTLKNDLALLPEPFFNARNFSNQLVVPFVFSAAPDKDTLNAAGIVSSWFGKLAAWRGTRFPANLNALPAGHAIVFVSNQNRPDFLFHYPEITGPGLEMMTNPVDGRSKLLLILGRNGTDQKIAAQALVMGNGALAGSHADIKSLQQEPPRQAYDAPNWVRMDRPMKFGEMVTSAQDLQVSGYNPQPIRLPFRIPPDLFTWRSRGIPIDLKYRYTPPLAVSESRLRMSVNDELLKSFALLPSGEVSKDRIRLPLIDDMVFGQSQELLLPSFKLGTRNELLFQFTTAAQKAGLCRETFNENVRDILDADSKIDFSGFPHYAEMPNLSYFATAGFPFTKYADLSQTIVVLPEHPTTYDIETMLTLLGRMGESTGYPATQFGIAHANENERLQNADLLVIGASLKEGLLPQWADKLPIVIRDGNLRNSQPKRNGTSWFDWLNIDFIAEPKIIAQQHINHNGALAAMLGFESPLSDKRSVVAIVSSQPQTITESLEALDHFNSDIHGSAVFIHPKKVEGVMVGDTYTIGELPFWLSIWYPFANHPVLLAILALVAVLVFAFALWRTLRLFASKRMSKAG